MRILVTGGAGFIGSRLTLRLVECGHEVTVLDSLSPQIHGPDPEASELFRAIAGRTRFLKGSVTVREDMVAALAGQESVVHLAAETGTGQSMYQVERYSDVNIGGTALLLDLLVNGEFPVRRVVVASSRSIYGEGRYRTADGRYVYPPHRSAMAMEAGDFEVRMEDDAAPLEAVATDEESRIHPSSVYGITKQVQEQLVMTVCPARGIEGVALRYQNVYGPGQSLTNPYTGILSIFSNQLMQGKPINIFEDGTESRDFVFIDDVVEATVLSIEHPAAADQVFNVGTGVPISVMTVAQELSRLLEVEVPIEITGNFRVGDIRHNYASTERIERLLGFRPKTDFGQGIAQFAAWARQSGPKSTNYEASLEEMRRKGLMK